MSVVRVVHTQERESTRSTLIEAAITVFAKHGFEGATVREIAELAGVNISSINYHFKGKDGLYRACLEPYAAAGNDMVAHVLRPASSAADFRLRLQLFLEGIFSSREKEGEVETILSRDFPDANPIATEVFLSSCAPNMALLNKFFRAAHDSGFIASKVDPDVASMLIIMPIINYRRYDRARQLTGLPPLFTGASAANTIAQIVAQCCDGTITRTP